MPSHCRMRAFDRDLIRGGHYGQRSCEPHLKAEHMAAPTNAAYVKKVLANSEPSTHGTLCQWSLMSVSEGRPELAQNARRLPLMTLADARSHGLALGRPSVDLGQRQRSFGAHAMFSRT